MKALQFFATVFTALALVPAGAHLFALPNKIHLAATDYFITQSVYNGWALFGVVLIGALVLDAALAATLRTRGEPYGFAAFAALCIAATLVIFFVFTFPANQATANWTEVPANWEALRRQWEYSHAVNALITFAGVCALILSLLSAARR